ncbi:MAG: CU044_2847 family protein [Microcoleaceae cyanobacterium]
MATKLIRLQDDTLVEVEIASDATEPVSGVTARRVSSALKNLTPLLVKTCETVVAALKEVRKTARVDTAEVEVGLNFEAEGNLYIARSKAGANLKVKFILKDGESFG